MEQPQMNLEALIERAAAIQRHLQDVQDALAETEVSGVAGEGMVSVSLTAVGELRHLSIHPDVVDPGRVEVLENLIRAALTDACRAVRQVAEEQLRPIRKGLDEITGGSVPG